MKSFHWYNDGKHTPYSEPGHTRWSSVHWNAIRMPLVDPVYTRITLSDPSYTCRVHHWKNYWKCFTLECHWRNFDYCRLHWNPTGGTATAYTYPGTYILSRVVSMPVWNDKMARQQAASEQVPVNSALTCSLLLCNAYQFCSSNMWVLQHYFVYLRYEHHFSFCVFGIAVLMKPA